MKILLMITFLAAPSFLYPMESNMDIEKLMKLLKDKEKNIQELDKFCTEHAPIVPQKMAARGTQESVYNKTLASWTQEEKRELLWCLQNTRMTKGRNGAPPASFGDKLGYYSGVVTPVDGDWICIDIIDFVAVTKLHHLDAQRPRHKFLIDQRAEPSECINK